ncbi:MAG: glycoside hydrolase family 15 protein [Gemmatimonadota bacterium]
MTDDSQDIFRETEIQDYAIIGDCRSAALVSRDGSIDWLCWPRFDSPSVFGAVLDSAVGGRWHIRPVAAEDHISRRYEPETAVLETVFTTSGGVVSLQDFMPVATEAEKSAELWPEHQILRRVECLEGHVEVETFFEPRPEYGRSAPRMRDRGACGVLVDLGYDALSYRSDIELQVGDESAYGRARLEAGDVVWSSLTFTRGSPAYLAPLGETAERRLRQTVSWWKTWAGGIHYEGPHADMVARSAITLKLLTYAPSGAVIAAPTTSLPEWIGQARNWDYRYCWLRDAAMTVRAFYGLGFREEGDAFTSWMLHATRLSWPEVAVLYDVYGNPPRAEKELDHLAGHRGSTPVRVGNAAQHQFQLDVYGEVAEAVTVYVHMGGSLDRSASKFLRGIAEVVCERWHEPDDGIWEARAEPRHYTYSKARCWSALRDLLSLEEDQGLDLPHDRMLEEMNKIRAAIETEGWNPELGSYVSWLGGDKVDATLLLLGELGASDDRERFAQTVHTIENELGDGPLVYRYGYDDGLEGSEGAFGICSFWRMIALARIGEEERARDHFSRFCGYANDLGLFAEEIDPRSGQALGNFPQAFTHVGLINAALTLFEHSAQEDLT